MEYSKSVLPVLQEAPEVGERQLVTPHGEEGDEGGRVCSEQDRGRQTQRRVDQATGP